MTTPNVPPLDRVRRDLAVIKHIVEKLMAPYGPEPAKGQTDTRSDVLAEIHRRAALATHDGFGTGRRQGERYGSGEGTPVEAAVLVDYRIDDETQEGHWTEPADPVLRVIADLMDGIGSMAKVARDVNKRRMAVLATADALRGRQSSLQGDCRACGRPVPGTPDDRLVSGYCAKDRKRWERAGFPDRVQFERGTPPWKAGAA